VSIHYLSIFHVFYATVEVLSQYDHPRICCNMIDQGAETVVDALPGMKYWCIPKHKRNVGSAELIRLVERHEVDVVMTFGDDKYGVEAALARSGYHKCFTMNYYSQDWSVWSEHAVTTPQLDYEASWQDVLFKRPPKGKRGPSR